MVRKTINKPCRKRTHNRCLSKPEKCSVLSKKICYECGEYKETTQKNICGICASVYNPMFSFIHLFPYI